MAADTASIYAWLEEFLPRCSDTTDRLQRGQRVPAEEIASLFNELDAAFRVVVDDLSKCSAELSAVRTRELEGRKILVEVAKERGTATEVLERIQQLYS